MFPGFSLHTELAAYVTDGLTPTALQSTTLNPARTLQGTGSLGTVTLGSWPMNAAVRQLATQPFAGIWCLRIVVIRH